MNLRVIGSLLFMGFGLGSTSPLLAQQKGQYVPGQYGLNAGLGIQPDPGFTFANITINYSASSFKNSNGNSVPVTGTYGFWAVESIFMYASPAKILRGQFTSMAALNAANASVTADLTPAQFGINGGGEGMGDTWVQPVNLGWHLKRVDTWVGYAFMAPTGKYFPLASNNIGSGYWGNNFATGTTFYVTKNKGTQLNLATNWEFHGQKRDTNITPGQAFTDEWGLGQILPLKKDLSRLLQLGVVGYDQWQVSANQGLTSGAPYYSRHAIGFQTNFIAPAKAWTLFFKYEPEYLAKASPQGRNIVFGFAWTLRDPKPKASKQ
ncbi:MAG TPA: transporter [Terriglobales bacterium]|nr:transporter [Terriglobales bacterium]